MLYEYLSFIPGSNTPHLHCCNKCAHGMSCVHVETFMLSDSLIRTLYVYKCPYMCQKWKGEESPQYKWDILSVRHVLVYRGAYSYWMPEHEYHNANHCTKAQNHRKKLPVCKLYLCLGQSKLPYCHNSLKVCCITLISKSWDHPELHSDI